MIGVVESFDRVRGTMWIFGADQRCYWAHRKDLLGRRELKTGQRVAFEPAEHRRGPRARAVRLVESREEARQMPIENPSVRRSAVSQG